MIEIYLAFFTHFLNEESLDKDSVDKLSKIQKHPFFDDISESYIPVFVVYPNTGIIQNCNA